MNTTLRTILLESLENKVKKILKQKNGTLFVPSPATCFQDSAGTIPCAVDDPIGFVKDLIGNNHATQATAGYKPILRGKVKNWLVNSATLSTQTVFVATSELTWTLAFEGSGTVLITGGYTGELIGSSGRVSLTFTTTSATNLLLTVTGTVNNAQLELGSVVSPYVDAASVPASSSYGPYWMDFDGTDDGLASTGWAAVAPTGGNPSVLMASAYNLKTVGDCIAYGAITSTSFRGILLWRSSWRTAASTDKDYISSTLYPAIYTEKMVSSTEVYGRKNGVIAGASTGAVAENTIATSLYIGKRSNGFEQLLGGIYALSAIPSYLDDNKILMVEKYLAKVTGVPL